MLEILVHARIGKVPRNHVLLVADVPADVSVERAGPEVWPAGWDALDDVRASRAFGDRWLSEKRLAILLVPSIVARLEWNALVNPAHPDAARIQLCSPEPLHWDERLFRPGQEAGS